MTPDPATAAEPVVAEDFRREIVTIGHDDRGPFAILACQHKVRPRSRTHVDTHLWCRSCAFSSPYR